LTKPDGGKNLKGTENNLSRFGMNMAFLGIQVWSVGSLKLTHPMMWVMAKRESDPTVQLDKEDDYISGICIQKLQ
jgi:hypothetical protein